MDISIKKRARNQTESMLCHLAPLPRFFPHPCRLNAIGYIPQKREWIDRTFQTINVSFILTGVGEYHIDGRRRPVAGPCAITQWPGIPVTYGPTDCWEELYLIFDEHIIGELQARRLLSRAKPMWRLQNESGLRDALAEMRALIEVLDRRGTTDRLDRLAERLILDSLLTEVASTRDPRDEAIRRIRTTVEKDFLVDHDFDGLARSEGFSPATFRRHWARQVHVPPHRYLLELRIHHACRLLVETQLSIAEIAAALAFQDPLYFSRVFSRMVGEPATSYRHRHPVPA